MMRSPMRVRLRFDRAFHGLSNGATGLIRNGARKMGRMAVDGGALRRHAAPEPGPNGRKVMVFRALLCAGLGLLALPVTVLPAVSQAPAPEGAPQPSHGYFFIGGHYVEAGNDRVMAG